MTGPARDRDPAGRPRNARPRDAFGRPLPRGAPGEQRIPDDLAVPPEEAVSMARARRVNRVFMGAVGSVGWFPGRWQDRSSNQLSLST